MSKLVALRLVKKIEPKELLQREEVHLRQRTKVKWVKEGVTTLKYFHKVANGRRKKKEEIFQIPLEERLKLEDQ